MRRMSAVVVFALMGALLVPAPARAQNCRSVPECLAFTGLRFRPDPLFAVVTGALAAPILVAGAVATVAGEMAAERPAPAGVLPLVPAAASARGADPEPSDPEEEEIATPAPAVAPRKQRPQLAL